MAIFRYCPLDRTELVDKEGNPYCPTCDRFFYRNPIPTASALIVRDGQILLGKRANNPSQGKYGVIGGFMNEEEHPEETAIREAKEESGLDIRIKRIVGIFNDTNIYKEGGHTVNIFYEAEVIGGEPQAGDDVATLEWFPIEQLPDDIAFRNTRNALVYFQKEYLAKKEKPPIE